MVSEGPRGQAQLVAKLAGIVQKCPGLARDQCQAQSLTLLLFQTCMVHNLLNELLDIVHFTGLDLQLDSSEQDHERRLQAAREGDGGSQTTEPRPYLSSPPFSSPLPLAPELSGGETELNLNMEVTMVVCPQATKELVTTQFSLNPRMTSSPESH